MVCWIFAESCTRNTQEIEIEEAQRAALQKSKNITVSDTADQWLRSQQWQNRKSKTISHCTARRIARLRITVSRPRGTVSRAS